MAGWQAGIRAQDPFWKDAVELLDSFPPDRFPDDDDLNRLLPPQARNQRGQPIRFIPSDLIPGVQYEQHIYATGEVSTRSNNWHDLFNAMMWMQFPLLKSAMNAMHQRSMTQPGSEESEAGRGKQRDALTLFDECGAIVIAEQRRNLEHLAQKDWLRVFEGGAASWTQRYRTIIVGHAMLEKRLKPYKSMTANTVLLSVPESVFNQSRPILRATLDTELAKAMLAGDLFHTSADLSPLPLMGIPGWWPHGEQDKTFYMDQSVFRPPADSFRPAEIFSLS